MNALPPAFPSARGRASNRAVAFGLTFASALLLVFVSNLTFAQSARPGLISQVIKDQTRVVLSGSVSPFTRRASDLGAVPASMPADRMLLLLRRSPEQESALRALIQSMHNPSSPSFHEWLTPAQFGAQWGAADSDVAAITAWLQSHGFSVKGPTPGRTAIEFSGTVGQVEEAFHTQIHAFRLNGVMHHANIADPQIPAALAPVVVGISMLNDFHPKSMATKGSRGIYDLTTHKAHPDLTVSSSYGPYLYLGPSDAATIYDSPIKTLNPTFAGNTVDGTGARIGIVGDSNISIAQNANYREIFGLAANAPTVILDGSTDPGENGDAVEAYLDTQVANGIAPGAKVYFYTAANTDLDYGLNLAILRAVNDNIVDILSVSFGECEAQLAYPGNVYYESIWEQAAAQGISVTVAAGDSGSAGCDDPNSETQAIYGLQVNGLASTPFDVAVGGTDFAVLAGPDGSGADFGNYVSSTNTTGTLRSALGYIPEVPWNDGNSVFPPGPVSTYVPFPSYSDSIVAGGGGNSNCSQGFTDPNGNPLCTAGYLKPSWQSAPGVPSDQKRDLPDVSLFAANGLFSASWGICTDQDTDSNNTPVADCTPGSNGLPANQFYIYGVGGTSSSAPAFAGMLALVKQSSGERQGLANYALYNLARTVPAVFHDTLTGNNSVPCQSGTTNCSPNSVGQDMLTGYNAGQGFDLATGLGSVDAAALVSNWSSAGLAATVTALNVASLSFEHGQLVTFDASVTSGAGIPTGDIALTAEANPPSIPLGSAIGTYQIVSNGSTGNVTINNFPGGNYKVVATYGGSAAFAGSSSQPVQLTVTPEPSTTNITLPAYNPVNGTQAPVGTVPYGYFVNLTGQPFGKRSPVVDGLVQPDAIAKGSVTFKDGSTVLGTEPLSSTGFAVVNGILPPPGNQSISASYSGDNNLLPSVTTVSVLVQKAATQLTLSSSASKYAGVPINFTVNLTTNSAGVAPTGTVALETGNTILAEVPLVGVAPTDTTVASGSATFSYSTFTPGAIEPIHAFYLGDANYASSFSNVVGITGQPAFVLRNTSTTLSSEHATAAVAIVTVSEGGYSGTIHYTCALETPTTTSTPPECAMDPATETLASNGTISPNILIFGKGTRLPPGVNLGSNQMKQSKDGWWFSGGAAVLAFCLLFGVPARRHAWKSILAVILLLVAIGGATACVKTPKLITAGKYSFTVTGTDANNSAITSTATVAVDVL